MSLTPLDIKKQEFKKSMRGFDTLEVESFLELVADEFESLIRERNALADEAIKLKTQLHDYQNVEKTLQDTLVSAQETIQTSRVNSEREAETIVREAQLESERILEESKIKLAKLRSELLIVKAQKDSFARRLKHLLESQLDLVEVLELDDLGFDKYEKPILDNRTESQEAATRDQADDVEFAGIDEVLPDEASRENEPGETTQQRDENLNVSENSVENESSNEEQIEDDQEKKARISDHLIF